MSERPGVLGRIDWAKELLSKMPRPCKCCREFYFPSNKKDSLSVLHGVCRNCDFEILGKALLISYKQEGRQLEQRGLAFIPFLDSGKEDVSVQLRLWNGRLSRLVFVGREAIQTRGLGEEMKQEYIRVDLVSEFQ